MPRIQEVKGRFFITLPRALVKAKKWRKGTELAAAFDSEGRISFAEVKDD